MTKVRIVTKFVILFGVRNLEGKAVPEATEILEELAGDVLPPSIANVTEAVHLETAAKAMEMSDETHLPVGDSKNFPKNFSELKPQEPPPVIDNATKAVEREGNCYWYYIVHFIVCLLW